MQYYAKIIGCDRNPQTKQILGKHAISSESVKKSVKNAIQESRGLGSLVRVQGQGRRSDWP